MSAFDKGHASDIIGEAELSFTFLCNRLHCAHSARCQGMWPCTRGKACVRVVFQCGRSSVTARRCQCQGGGRWVNCEVRVRVIRVELQADWLSALCGWMLSPLLMRGLCGHSQLQKHTRGALWTRPRVKPLKFVICYAVQQYFSLLGRVSLAYYLMLCS